MGYNWEEIIEGCKRGERKFQLEAYQQSWRIIFPAVHRIIQNRQESEDVMQESIIRGFSKMDQLSDPNKYIGWQKSISIRMAYSFLIERKRLLFDFHKMEIEESEAQVEYVAAEYATLMNALNKLAKGYQAIVRMHLFDGLKHEEIGELLGIGTSTARSQYSRALSRIKQYINEKGNE
ncbi:MAG: RNA polymerase sigma factor [Flavobacteriales bacterium]|nr:RNA polymerase sigma factor [Flavobacteriales bacterium]